MENFLRLPSDRSFRADESEDSLRLDLFLLRKEIGGSRKIAQKIIERGWVEVNGKHVIFPSRRVLQGDVVRVYAFELFHPPLKKARLRIISADDSIVVADKPSGMLSVAEKGDDSVSAVSVVKKILTERNLTGAVFPVHRLDRETSGVMVFARTLESKRRLEEQFKKRMVEKKYLAIVQGIVRRKAGTLKGVMKTSCEFGESTYNVLERLKKTSLVEVCPKTGKTNQIRIQFSEAGYPLIGENKFLNPAAKPKIIFGRVALHSAWMRFRHPSTNEILIFSTELPDDFKKLLNFLS